MDSTPRPATKQRSTLRWLARALIPVLVLAAGLFASTLLLSGLPETSLASLIGRTLTGIVATTLAIGAIWLMKRRGTQTHCDRNGRVRDALGTMSLGILAWFIPAGVMLAIPGIGASIEVEPDAPDKVAAAVLLLFAVFFGQALPEEFVFRGHLQSTLLERLDRWPTISLQALVFTVFGLAVGGWGGWLELSMYLAMGFVLGYLRMRIGSVWLGIGFHTAFLFGAQSILTHGLLEVNSDPWLVLLVIGPVPFTFVLISGAVRDKPAREAGSRIGG